MQHLFFRAACPNSTSPYSRWSEKSWAQYGVLWNALLPILRAVSLLTLFTTRWHVRALMCSQMLSWLGPLWDKTCYICFLHWFHRVALRQILIGSSEGSVSQLFSCTREIGGLSKTAWWTIALLHWYQLILGFPAILVFWRWTWLVSVEKKKRWIGLTIGVFLSISNSQE